MTPFRIEARSGAARAGVVTTPHGEFHTPSFMPVGTQGAVKALHPDEVRACGAEVVLCNAYHLALRPGADVVERLGGLHRFMGWDGPILTDSGGYQLVSLDAVARVDDDSATFVSPYDGSRMRVTPEDAIGIQRRLGADILMCLDHPVAWGADPGAMEAATVRTHRWAERCRAMHPGDGRLLFGIVQGGFEPASRVESARRITAIGFDGIAIGGLSVGEPLDVMLEMTALSVAEVPDSLPRYFMGLGTDAELLAAVALGVDMFDCVAPTRLARNGTALTPEGPINLRNAVYREDVRPIDERCPCAACERFSRAYLRHLFAAGEILAHRLVTVHNVTHLCALMAGARAAIREGTFALQHPAAGGRFAPVPR